MRDHADLAILDDRVQWGVGYKLPQPNLTESQRSTQVKIQALLTTEAAAQILDVSYPPVRRMMRDGRLSFVRLGSSVRIPVAAIAAYVESQQRVSV